MYLVGYLRVLPALQSRYAVLGDRSEWIVHSDKGWALADRSTEVDIDPLMRAATVLVV
jgi:hypothetical protein